LEKGHPGEAKKNVFKKKKAAGGYVF